MRRMYSEKQLEVITEELLNSGTVPSIKADSIIENMEDYSFTKNTLDTKINYNYVGVVKTGNKITFCIFAYYLSETNLANQSIDLGKFTLPQEVLDKLIPYTFGVQENILAQSFVSYTGENINTPQNGSYAVFKVEDGITVTWYSYPGSIVANRKANVRIEFTFLLSENLAN